MEKFDEIYTQANLEDWDWNKGFKALIFFNIIKVKNPTYLVGINAQWIGRF
jgi:hypothetical protein